MVAGGSGQRFGGRKQFADLSGRRVLDWAVGAARAASDGVVVVVPVDEPVEAVNGSAVVAGGSTRTQSVRNGLAAVPAEATIICVHDAARPFAGTDLFERVIAPVAGGADAAVPGIALADTVKQVDDTGVVVSTPSRASLRAVQTPQAFRADLLRRAHATGAEATDDAALVESLGATVVVVDGDPDNQKITGPADLDRARRRVGDTMRTRVGQGFDIHRFSDDPSRRLVLGGVTFDDAPGLHGHSDADVVAHAVTDALLGAAGLGDIGEMFPDTDEQWRGADSIGMLRRAASAVRERGWSVGNVDCALVCETPKIAPRRGEMQQRLSDAAGGPVTVKGRRAEGLGALGRREGIACWAVAVLVAVEQSS